MLAATSEETVQRGAKRSTQQSSKRNAQHISQREAVCATACAAAVAASHASDIASLPALGYDDPLAILGSAPFPDEPWWKRLSPSTIFVLLAGAIGIFVLLHELLVAGGLGLPVDESWIDQVYAKNFFRHLAFVFNPGEHTAGPAAPFWVVFLAFAQGLFHDPMVSAKLLGSIFLFLTGYYVFRALRMTDHDYGTALLGGLLTMSSGSLVWAELSGLESTLSTALIAGGMWWYFSEAPGWRRYITGGVFALAALTRPETALIFVLLVTHGFFAERREHRTKDAWKHLLLMLAAFAVVLLPIVVTNIAISSAVVPETFYAGLTRESLVVLLRHGRISEIGLRLLLGFRSVWFTMLSIYASINPVFLASIPLAALARSRERLVQRDRSDVLFNVSVLVLLVFPYLRAVAVGIDDCFGEYGRWMHFLVPIYVLCGVASVRMLLRYFFSRKTTPRVALFTIGSAVLLAGAAQLALRAPVASFAVVKPEIDLILLVFFVGVLMAVAMRYAEIPLWKREIPHFVSEAERNRMVYHAHESTEADHLLSEPVMRLLRAALLVTVAWTASLLPRSANDFALDVLHMNTVDIPLARSIASATQPTDVIATNMIGAIRWWSERRVVDVLGRLTTQASHNRRTLGSDRGVLETLMEARPEYYLPEGAENAALIRAGISSGFFTPVLATANGLTLYRIDYGRPPLLSAANGD